MIVYKAKKGNGGFGDRLIGLASCIYLSELLKEEMFIDWSSPAIEPYFDYNSISDYRLQNIRLIDSRDELVFIENIPDLKLYFSNKSIESNLNFIDKLFINKKFDRKLYEESILKTYQELFSRYLIPKKNLLESVENNTGNFRGKTIGIQLRMGDAYMDVGDYKGLKIEYIEDIFASINDHQEFDSIFLTSDNYEIITKAKSYFKEKNIIYNYERIKHTDRMNVSYDELLKVLSDMMTLSRTDYRYLSLGSSFGRVSNLISHSPQSYKVITQDGLIDLTIEGLLSTQKTRQ